MKTILTAAYFGLKTVQPFLNLVYSGYSTANGYLNCNMIPSENIIVNTHKWIEDVVVGCNFCPFAARELARDSVRFTVIEKGDIGTSLQAFLDECIYLDENPGTETSFLIIPEGFSDFLAYLDLVGLAEELLENEGFEGIYQVASFHPEYMFEGSPADDPANYTNRSPYPMLHLLREQSIEKALEHYKGDPEEIPGRNVDFAREKGIVYMKMLRDLSMK